MRDKIVAFDADDTLWVNETIFTSTRDKFKNLIGQYTDVDQLEDRLYRTEKRNLGIFGYGIKGFTLSMIETAIEITREQISSRDIHQITIRQSLCPLHLELRGALAVAPDIQS